MEPHHPEPATLPPAVSGVELEKPLEPPKPESAGQTGPVELPETRSRPSPQQQQIGLEALVAILMSSGAKVGLALQLDDENKAIRLLAVCGPLQIPCDLPTAKAREFGQRLLDAADKYDPPQESAEAAEETGLDDLLAEAQANVAGDDDDEPHHPNEDLTYIMAAETDPVSPPEPAEPSRLILPSHF